LSYNWRFVIVKEIAERIEEVIKYPKISYLKESFYGGGIEWGESMIDDEKKDYFNKQLDDFIRGIQEDLHLSYKETIWMIIDGIFNSAWFQKEFYILENKTWSEKSVWIRNFKIVQKEKKTEIQ